MTAVTAADIRKAYGITRPLPTEAVEQLRELHASGELGTLVHEHFGDLIALTDEA